MSLCKKQLLCSLPIFLHIFNVSGKGGVFPVVLKPAKMVPIFQSVDNTSPEHYKPISVLNFIATVFEKHIHERIFSLMANNNILCNEHFGSRQRLYTTEAVVEYPDHVYERIHTGSKIVTNFLEFSRTFYTVKIYILLKKLKHCNIK